MADEWLSEPWLFFSLHHSLTLWFFWWLELNAYGFMKEGQQECFYGVNPAMAEGLGKFTESLLMSSVVEWCCLTHWSWLYRTEWVEAYSRVGMNQEACYIWYRSRPRAIKQIWGGFTLQHPCTLSDIASHHSFPLKVFLFCFLYFSTQCSDVFVFLFLVCWYEPGFDFSPDCIPRLILSLPLSYASQYESTPTEADDRQINYSDAC